MEHIISSNSGPQQTSTPSTPNPAPARAAHTPFAVPAVTDPIARTDAIVRQVRQQCVARLAWPWRYDEYPLTALAEPVDDAADAQLMWELDGWHRATIQADHER